ncbi:Nudix family hydrolase [Chitinibacter sp. SCUT-21]|uniref:Nudix family hydrolase n=1 Tax=Chitinibacter sp. SCUT-21 TaxID=2970891 RepID=UPI0035A70E44
MNKRKVTRVAAGILIKRDGQFLLASRPQGKPYAGYWEFPGGKLEEGESALEALSRELKEELGIELAQATPWLCQRFEYPHALVELNFFRVTSWQGELHSHEGQQFAWQKTNQLSVSPILPANGPILRGLSLPNTLLFSPAGLIDDESLMQQAAHYWQYSNMCLVLREPQRSVAAYAKLCKQLAALPRPHGGKLIAHGEIAAIGDLPVDGIHLTSAQLMVLNERPRGFDWVGASTHDETQLAKAQKLGVDYAVLGHVNQTASHPNQAPLGWDKFAQLLALGWAFPCFAIGGQTCASIPTAQTHGAHGVAILSGAWR